MSARASYEHSALIAKKLVTAHVYNDFCGCPHAAFVAMGDSDDERFFDLKKVEDAYDDLEPEMPLSELYQNP